MSQKKQAWRELYPTDHLCAEDLNGQELTVTISEIKKEKVRGDNGNEEKLVAYFKGGKKGMVLNVTNLKTLQDLTGKKPSEQSMYYEDYVGLKVKLFAKEIKAFGEWMLALRFKKTVVR